MNNADLEKLLRAAGVPERAPDYWEQFPGRMTAALHWRAQRPTTYDVEPARRARFGGAAWGVGLAAVCVILGFAVGFWRGRETGITPAQLAVAQRYFHEIETLFPNQLQAIVFDEQGPRVVLADQPNLPNVAPIYLRVCGPRGCQHFITFSGQEIEFAGQQIAVLADSRGGIILLGNQFVWSNTERIYAGNHLKIEAINLGAEAM